MYIPVIRFIFMSRPKANIKVALANAVVTEFPFLKDDEGQGFVSTEYII